MKQNLYKISFFTLFFLFLISCSTTKSTEVVVVNETGEKNVGTCILQTHGGEELERKEFTRLNNKELVFSGLDDSKVFRKGNVLHIIFITPNDL